VDRSCNDVGQSGVDTEAQCVESGGSEPWRVCNG
jgi:hypothetical protein